MQPLQNDLRCPAAKDNNITYAAAAPSNLDAAIAMRSPVTAHKPDLGTKAKKIEALFRRNFKRKITSAKTEKTC